MRSSTLYIIKSDKGYWLAGGFGYTNKKTEAGQFSTDELASHNLDGCTLYRCARPRPSRFTKQVG